jgi:hypothetical protein
MINYTLIKTPYENTPSSVFRSDGWFIPIAPSNTDYQAFKTALQTGKNADGTDVVLNDATGTAMTSDQITTFLGTLL